jgi:hypothetical protein
MRKGKLTTKKGQSAIFQPIWVNPPPCCCSCLLLAHLASSEMQRLQGLAKKEEAISVAADGNGMEGGGSDDQQVDFDC